MVKAGLDSNHSNRPPRPRVEDRARGVERGEEGPASNDDDDDEIEEEEAEEEELAEGRGRSTSTTNPHSLCSVVLFFFFFAVVGMGSRASSSSSCSPFAFRCVAPRGDEASRGVSSPHKRYR